jgi:hypothetical protein
MVFAISTTTAGTAGTKTRDGNHNNKSIIVNHGRYKM